MDFNDVDVEAMSKATGQAVCTIRERLGLSCVSLGLLKDIKHKKDINNASTVDEIRELWKKTRIIHKTRQNTRRKAEALSLLSTEEKVERFSLLSLKDLTIDEIHEKLTEVKEQRQYTEEKNESIKEQAILMRWICLTSTVDEIREVYKETPFKSKMQQFSLVKWIDLASTVDEIREAQNYALLGSLVEKLAFEKLALFFIKQ